MRRMRAFHIRRRNPLWEYALNGWQSPWIRKNSLWYALFHR